MVKEGKGREGKGREMKGKEGKGKEGKGKGKNGEGITWSYWCIYLFFFAFLNSLFLYRYCVFLSGFDVIVLTFVFLNSVFYSTVI